MNTEKHFLKFHHKKDRLDEFIWPFLMRLSDNKELCTMCKVIFVLSHGQSFTERGFFINKEVLDGNIQEKSLISQRIVYDTIQSCYDGKVLDFQVTPVLHKSCRQAHQKYKLELKNMKDSRKEDNFNLKRKLKQDEIQNVKKQKINVEDAINAFRKSFKSETAADKEQDLNRLSMATAFVNMISEKEETLKQLSDVEKKKKNQKKNLKAFKLS